MSGYSSQPRLGTCIEPHIDAVLRHGFIPYQNVVGYTFILHLIWLNPSYNKIVNLSAPFKFFMLFKHGSHTVNCTKFMQRGGHEPLRL